MSTKNVARPMPGGGCLPSLFWEERDSQLHDLAAEGITTTEAAKVLGVTKNSVIGRSARIGVVWARRPKKPQPPPTPPALPPDLPPVLLLPIQTIEFPPSGHCLYGHGHPNEPGFRFCGERVVEVGESWCADHFLVVYRPQARQEAA